ncbi:MAG: hypothetical protein Tsb0021_17770 [Chlamydiales bacterium]
MKYRFFFLFPFIFLPLILLGQSPDMITDHYLKALNEPGAILFTPPENWRVVDPTTLPKTVKAMVVGKGKYELPPSINLGMHPYEGSLKDYLKMVKATNEAENIEWKDLGTIKTVEGLIASLSQAELKTQWGDLRELQVILKKDDMIYILTAAAIKEEFPQFYNTFFSAMKSLRFNRDTVLTQE